MTLQEAKNRIVKLKKLINYHRYLYHVLDRQEISDAALDSLKHELYKLERTFPQFITPDSPTQRVGGEPLKEFKKVRHTSPMLSIEDIFSQEELQDWENYIKKLEPDFKPAYFAELKIDGFAIALTYQKGFLVRGATRGNGLIGEDVTSNLKTIESIPLSLEIKNENGVLNKEFAENLAELVENGTIEIRGEVYMTKKDFNDFNEKQKKKGLAAFANPRNLAAGSIRQLDPRSASIRPLKFLAYDALFDIGQQKHSQEHQILPCLGFKADPGKVCSSLAETVDFWERIGERRETLPFQIDGVVISIDDNRLFKKLGVAGKSPRGIRAFKFSPKQATTRILDIKVQVGRTGAVTPVAVLEPVGIGGTKISRATLHNEDEIKKLGLKIGDTVIVQRAGDVIPAIEAALPELRTGEEKEFHFPRECPVCKTKLTKPENEAVWRCLNSKCPAKKMENLYHFASKKTFDIEGLGPKIIDQLVDASLISRPNDIFLLQEGDLLSLPRFGEKSANNLISAIQKSKKISLDHFIFSLGIRNVGEKLAHDLALYFSNKDGSISGRKAMEMMEKASKEELEKISDVGPKVSENIFNWFHSPVNLKLLADLFTVGVEIEPLRFTGGKLIGKRFVLTGVLETMSREEAKEKVILLGGEVSESVSLKTDYLVTGKEPGSKLGIARKLGIKVISEEEFLNILK